MTIETAIQCAKDEAASFKTRVLVVESPKEKVEQGSMPYFPCRKDWFDGFGHDHRIVAEAYPNGKVWKAR